MQTLVVVLVAIAAILFAVPGWNPGPPTIIAAILLAASAVFTEMKR
jgi:hypothetical protein